MAKITTFAVIAKDGRPVAAGTHGNNDAFQCRGSRVQTTLLLAFAVLLSAGISSLKLTAIAGAKSPEAQSDSAAGQGSRTLEGTVVDALTERPVTGAEVRLVTDLLAFPNAYNPHGLPAAARPSPKPPHSATTDASGRFIIQDIRAGSYRIGAVAKGYYKHEVGARTPIGSPGTPVDIGSDRVKPLVIRLTPGATLGGRIINDEQTGGLKFSGLRIVGQSASKVSWAVEWLIESQQDLGILRRLAGSRVDDGASNLSGLLKLHK